MCNVKSNNNSKNHNNKSSKDSHQPSREQRFLTELDQAAEATSFGVYLWKDLFFDDDKNTKEEQLADAFDLLNNDANFPWVDSPKLFGERLTQHAYNYDRSKVHNNHNKHAGLSWLEDVCDRIEERFDVTVYDVFCNRFVDPRQHKLDWHTDQYGAHIMVLTLGSERNVQFRPHRQKIAVESIRPAAGDLYFMPLHVNATHQHRVCSAARSADDETCRGVGPRISLVFFVGTPAYAPRKYKISWRQRLRGVWEELRERLG